MPKAIKIEVEVDYIQLKRSKKSILACSEFIYGKKDVNTGINVLSNMYARDVLNDQEMQVKTSNGWMPAKFGDYIIKDAHGCYVRSAESFKRNYKPL